MKKYALLLIAAVAMLGGSARAADVTIKLNDQEQKAFLQLLDLAARQGGIQASGAVAFFANKLQPQPAQPTIPTAAKPDDKKPETPAKN